MPHASRNVPDWARARLPLDDVGQSRELDALTDAHTDLIAQTSNHFAEDGYPESEDYYADECWFDSYLDPMGRARMTGACALPA